MSCENVFKHGEKLKKCDQCDFTFSDAGILKHTVEKIQTSAASVTLHQSRLSLWGNIYKRIVEKSKTSATNMIFKNVSIVISSHNESFHVFESEWLWTVRAYKWIFSGVSSFVHLQIWKRARNKLTLVARIRFVCFFLCIWCGAIWWPNMQLLQVVPCCW